MLQSQTHHILKIQLCQHNEQALKGANRQVWLVVTALVFLGLLKEHLRSYISLRGMVNLLVTTKNEQAFACSKEHFLSSKKAGSFLPAELAQEHGTCSTTSRSRLPS
jgi:hypothetical protein